MSFYIYPTDALKDVAKERRHQEELRLQGKFPYTCAALGVVDEVKLSILAEEFGEVARLVCEQTIERTRRDPTELRKELIQVAAVATAWAEAIDAEAPVAPIVERTFRCIRCDRCHGNGTVAIDDGNYSLGLAPCPNCQEELSK